jgi:hypothetical protein
VFDRTIPIYRQERTTMTTSPKADPTPIYTETVKDHPELFSKQAEAPEEVHVGEPADEVHVR